MIRLQPTWGLVLRHARLWMRDINLILVTLYWPLLDILVWGFLGTWVQKSQSSISHNYQSIALLGILLWQVTCRGSIVLFGTLLEEITSFNLNNIFSMPLRITEWIAGALIFDFIMGVINVGYCVLLMVLFYQLPILHLLKVICIFAPPLFISGVALGFICLQLISHFGKRAQELGFVIAWFFVPFSAAVYPLEALPNWAQTISYCIPMSYIFEGMRIYLTGGENPTAYLIKGYLMALIYAAVAIIGFVYVFERTKIKGLARLSD